ncbi:hypothetical protein L2E82_45992 [Cichorium intybus]|uniref:Uncharacterized protein n=1 Tax=Cichorium intybus TaxID=13427 RepID=A0ACB8ZUK4_CICIN|nr:hypothetical protein L2E82_45992 [Cichorium intybus]
MVFPLLIDHANTILSLATLAYEEIQMVVKIPTVYWWYKSISHAAKLTAGYYNPDNHDGYSILFKVMNSAWDEGLCLAGQNGYPCYDREVFMRLLETAKPSNDPDVMQLILLSC